MVYYKSCNDANVLEQAGRFYRDAVLAAPRDYPGWFATSSLCDSDFAQLMQIRVMSEQLTVFRSRWCTSLTREGMLEILTKARGLKEIHITRFNFFDDEFAESLVASRLGEDGGQGSLFDSGNASLHSSAEAPSPRIILNRSDGAKKTLLSKSMLMELQMEKGSPPSAVLFDGREGRRSGKVPVKIVLSKQGGDTETLLSESMFGDDDEPEDPHSHSYTPTHSSSSSSSSSSTSSSRFPPNTLSFSAVIPRRNEIDSSGEEKGPAAHEQYVRSSRFHSLSVVRCPGLTSKGLRKLMELCTGLRLITLVSCNASDDSIALVIEMSQRTLRDCLIQVMGAESDLMLSPYPLLFSLPH